MADTGIASGMPIVSPSSAPVVVIVDDERMSIAGLAALLAANGFVVGATVTDVAALSAAVMDRRPTLVVIDPAMGDAATTVHAISALVDEQGTPVLAFSRDLSLAAVHAALESGCLGIIPKTASVAEVLRAAVAVSAREQHVHQRALTVLVHGLQASGAAGSDLVPLTPRELDVLVLIADGLTNASIADRLSIAPATVKTHVENLLHKLEASDRAHAVSTAMRRHLLS